MAEAHRGKACPGIERFSVQKIPPEGEIFQHAQSRFQGIAVAEIMRLFGRDSSASPPSRLIAPSAIVSRPADHRQQRGFA